MSMSQDILKMFEYCKDLDMISEAFGINNLQLLEDFLAGKVDAEIIDRLEQDDPHKSSEVIIVNKERLLRSRVIGVFSPGGTGATTLASSLAFKAAQRMPGNVAVVDYNEQSDLPLFLGVEVHREGISRYLNTIPRHKDNFVLEPEPHPKMSNLFMYSGATGFMNVRSLTPADYQAGVEHIARSYPISVIDCPQSPLLWNTMLPLLDVYIFIVRQDLMGLHFVMHLQKFVESQGIQNKLVLVSNMENQPGLFSTMQFNLQARNIGLEASFSLPHDPAIVSTANQNGIVAEKLSGSKYMETIGLLLDTLGIQPATQSITPKSSGFFAKMGNMFARA